MIFLSFLFLDIILLLFSFSCHIISWTLNCFSSYDSFAFYIQIHFSYYKKLCFSFVFSSMNLSNTRLAQSPESQDPQIRTPMSLDLPLFKLHKNFDKSTNSTALCTDPQAQGTKSTSLTLSHKHFQKPQHPHRGYKLFFLTHCRDLHIPKMYTVNMCKISKSIFKVLQ